MAWAKKGSGKSLSAKKKWMNIDILKELIIPAEKMGPFIISEEKIDSIVAPIFENNLFSSTRELRDET